MGVRRLSILNPSANTDTVLFTADNQYLLSVVAANKSTTTASTLRVWIEPSGSSSPSQYAYIVYDIPVDASNSYETFRFAVNQNDIVKIRASQSTMSIQSYGLVQYDVNLGVGISSYSQSAPGNLVDGLIWVDSDGMLPGSSAKPAYVWSSAANNWIQMAGTIDTSANYTFTGTVVVPGYEKLIPLQSSAPSSPASGDLWVDSTISTAPILKVYNGSSWIATATATNDRDLVISQRMFA